MFFSPKSLFFNINMSFILIKVPNIRKINKPNNKLINKLKKLNDEKKLKYKK